MEGTMQYRPVGQHKKVIRSSELFSNDTVFAYPASNESAHRFHDDKPALIRPLDCFVGKTWRQKFERQALIGLSKERIEKF